MERKLLSNFQAEIVKHLFQLHRFAISFNIYDGKCFCFVDCIKNKFEEDLMSE